MATTNLNMPIINTSTAMLYGALTINSNLETIDDAIGRNNLVLSATSVNALPHEFSNSKIKKEHRVVNIVLSNPEAQVGDWTYTTIDGKLTLSGTISASTHIYLFLAEEYGAGAVTNMKIPAPSIVARTTVLSSSNITSDTSILSLEPGFYQVREASATVVPYLPTNYGTLIVGRSGNTYRAYVFINTSGDMYFRHGTSSAWNSDWMQSDHSKQFGDTSKTLATVLTENWQNEIPNAKPYPILVQVQADSTNYYGFLSRYSTKYGSGVLTRYDGKCYLCFLNNSTVTVRSIGEDVSTGTITKASRVTSGTVDCLTCRKTGNVVTVSGRIHTITDNTVKANGECFVIPSGFRPGGTVYCSGYVNITGTGGIPTVFSIDSSGNVTLYYSNNYYMNQVAFFGCYGV